MSIRTLIAVVASAVTLLVLGGGSFAQTEKWNNPGRGALPIVEWRATAAAPRRDLTGIWDSGRAGVSGLGMSASAAPFTPLGEQLAKMNRPTVGPRIVPIADANDPVATFGDPAGFPRNDLFENRVIQIVQTMNQVIVLYQFEKRWRVIWTDDRAFPQDPDPRFYGYSVGRWEDDLTFVVDTIGLDERTWIDNSGLPHSSGLRVEERFRRVDNNTLDLSVTIVDPAVYKASWRACFTPTPSVPCVDRLRFNAMPRDTDMLEWVPTASEAAEYQKLIAVPNKR